MYDEGSWQTSRSVLWRGGGVVPCKATQALLQAHGPYAQIVMLLLHIHHADPTTQNKHTHLPKNTSTSTHWIESGTFYFHSRIIIPDSVLLQNKTQVLYILELRLPEFIMQHMCRRKKPKQIKILSFILLNNLFSYTWIISKSKRSNYSCLYKFQYYFILQKNIVSPR